MIPVDDFTGGNNLLLLSKNGWMKQVELSAFSSALRRSGLLAMKMVSPSLSGLHKAVSDFIQQVWGSGRQCRQQLTNPAEAQMIANEGNRCSQIQG